MNFKLLSVLLLALSGWLALAQPTNYLNTAVVLAPPEDPPQIDALNFVNQNIFIINFTNTVIPDFPPPIGQLPYATENTLNYTNTKTGFMSCNAGFDFETYIPGNAVADQVQQASTFFNAGTINCGTLDTSNYLTVVGIHNIGVTNVIVAGLPGTRTYINASNIVNPGIINMGYESLLSIVGNSVDLNGATLSMASNGASLSITSSNSVAALFFNTGVFDDGWGLGDPRTQPIVFYPAGFDPVAYYGNTPPTTPEYIFTSRSGSTYARTMTLSNAFTYYNIESADPANVNYQLVYVSNPNPDLGQNVYLLNDGTSVVEFTNKLGTSAANIYVIDYFGTYTNFYLLFNGFAGSIPQDIPWNYDIFLSTPLNNFLGPPSPAASLPGGFFVSNELVTNQYTAYTALFQPGSVILSDTFGQDITNVPGRIEITGDNELSLSNAQVVSLNYIKLEATNHFIGSKGALISAPFEDLILRCTNGLLEVTNLVVPSVARPLGTLDLYSARWTNVVAGITNSYAVLYVDASLAPTAEPYLRTLSLTSTNVAGGPDSVLISDGLNVSNLFLIDTLALTITTNGPGSPTPNGFLNILITGVLWPSAFPRLEYLTNNGVIASLNEMIFGGSQTSPYTTGGSPYAAFVNSGSVTNYGSQIEALYFQNNGVFDAISGFIDLEQAQVAMLTNGAFLAPFGSITVDSTWLLVSNHVMQSGGTLTLSDSYYLDDGSYAAGTAFEVTNQNFWSISGLDLPVLPTYSSLLATTITNTSAAASPAVQNIWAGNDLGRSPNGFVNNAAVGQLILDALNSESLFVFQGPGSGSNAIYIDNLQFEDYATNFDNEGNSLNVEINSGMTIYYAQALAGGISIAEKLSGRYGMTGTNGGQFLWVSNYNCGYFSSTTETNGGSVYLVNSALRNSKDIDSGNGLNFEQAFPIPVSEAGCPVGQTGIPDPAPSPISPPAVVELTAPVNGASFAAPATINLAANVTGNGQTISGVDFYNSGGTLLGTAAAPPYSVTWTNVAAGSYNLGAKVRFGSSSMAALPASVTVIGERSTNQPPSTNSLNGALALVPPSSDTNIPGPVKLKGVYHGLFSDTNTGVNVASAGYFMAVTTASGGVSAKIAVGGRTYSFTGSFGGSGTVGGRATQGSSSLGVQLQLSSDNQQIQGTISNGASWSAALQADLQTATAAGTYTMVIPPAASGPQGYGFGSVTVDDKGNLKWSGVLADGTKVTQSSAVSQQRFWPLYAPLYNGGGAVLSWMQFVTGGVEGDLIWIRPAGGASSAYADGFTNEVEATGSIFNNPTVGDRVLDWPGGLGSVIFDGGGLGAPMANQIKVSGNHGKEQAGAYKLTLSITPSSHLFSGSLTMSKGQRPVSFGGAIWDGTNGAGFFLNPSSGQSGSVLLQP